MSSSPHLAGGTRQARLGRLSWRAFALACASACASIPPADAGASAHGAAVILHVGCGSCHRIAGVAGAQGRIGPDLRGLRERQYLAGVLLNTPENLARWVRRPQQFKPETVMPDVGLNEQDAEDVAAYLVH